MIGCKLLVTIDDFVLVRSKCLTWFFKYKMSPLFCTWKTSYGIANQTQLSFLKIATSSHSFLYEMRTAARAARKISYKRPTKFNFHFENRHFLSNRPLIFKFVYLKSGQPNSNSTLENRHFLSHRPPNFWTTRNLSQNTPAARILCVEKIGSRPRGNLSVDTNH